MRAQTLQTWIARHIWVRLRLERVCTSYLLFLMVVTTKHSLEEAARFTPTTTSIVDIIAIPLYAVPAYSSQPQEVAHVTSVSDRKRRMVHAHV